MYDLRIIQAMNAASETGATTLEIKPVINLKELNELELKLVENIIMTDPGTTERDEAEHMLAEFVEFNRLVEEALEGYLVLYGEWERNEVYRKDALVDALALHIEPREGETIDDVKAILSAVLHTMVPEDAQFEYYGTEYFLVFNDEDEEG